MCGVFSECSKITKVGQRVNVSPLHFRRFWPICDIFEHRLKTSKFWLVENVFWTVDVVELHFAPFFDTSFFAHFGHYLKCRKWPKMRSTTFAVQKKINVFPGFQTMFKTSQNRPKSKRSPFTFWSILAIFYILEHWLETTKIHILTRKPRFLHSRGRRTLF